MIAEHRSVEEERTAANVISWQRIEASWVREQGYQFTDLRFTLLMIVVVLIGRRNLDSPATPLT